MIGVIRHSPTAPISEIAPLSQRFHSAFTALSQRLHSTIAPISYRSHLAISVLSQKIRCASAFFLMSDRRGRCVAVVVVVGAPPLAGLLVLLVPTEICAALATANSRAHEWGGDERKWNAGHGGVSASWSWRAVGTILRSGVDEAGSVSWSTCGLGGSLARRLGGLMARQFTSPVAEASYAGVRRDAGSLAACW